MNEPLRLTDHKAPVLAYVSPRQRNFLQDLREDFRGRPFWGKLEVTVQHGEPVGLKVLEETRGYGG